MTVNFTQAVEIPTVDNPSTTQVAKITKKRRWHSGTVANREIRKLSRSTNVIIPKTSFARLVREITQDLSSTIRWKADAINALQDASESYLTEGFMTADRARHISGHKTLCLNDFKYNAQM